MLNFTRIYPPLAESNSYNLIKKLKYIGISEFVANLQQLHKSKSKVKSYMYERILTKFDKKR
ncbi:MAG: hypothetical protein A3G95_07550 [Flavobacteria bacterium RIFCSPLOWO2_12_FULL_31_7]|nr:MAG: hypothetical protein A3G95_07550 [Flavobacteria bacterium RIFCSPLOWO2_12_FULL_31_7]